MPDQPVLAIFAQSQPVKNYLADLVRGNGYQAVVLDSAPEPQAVLVVAAAQDFAAIPHSPQQKVLWLTGSENNKDEIGEGVRVLKTPSRASAIMQLVERILAAQGALPDQIVIGAHMLDTRESLWVTEEASPVRLTEKEVAILLFLYDSAPSSVSKQALLEKVWAYADGVETHTLETHIYRLRQKIEIDPSDPKILLTEDDGYRISGG